MFDLRHDFADYVTAEHVSSDDDTMSADEKLMTVIIDLKQLLTVKYACK